MSADDRDGWSLDDLFGAPADSPHSTQPPAGRPDDYTAPAFPPPPGVPPLQPRTVQSALQPPPVQQAPQQQAPQEQPGSRTSTRGRLRGPQVVGIAAVTALLVGGVSGFGGALAAGWRPGAEVATPSSSSAPTNPGPAESADPSAPAEPPAEPQSAEDTVGIASKVLPSTVTISVTGTDRSSSGSGFVLDAEGRIMTNNHVVEGAVDSGSLRVEFNDGTRAEAEIVGRSPSYDLAVIQVSDPKGLTPSDIGDSESARVGDAAVAVGSPLGLGGTVTRGIISAQDRPVVVGGSDDGNDASAYINALQTDAPINPGNSGGPLVDGAGRVIGVNSAILSLTGGGDQQAGSIGLGFAIPINQAMEIGAMLIKDGHATYPVIGATVQTVGDEEGVRIREVTPGSPAEDAGLRSRDVITSLDGESMTEMVELIVAIRTHRPGDEVTLGYERNGANREAEVTLGSKEG